VNPTPQLSLHFLPRELPVRIVPEAPLDDAALYELCLRNPDLRIERSAAGELIVMPPTGGESGRKNASLTTDLTIWARADGTGMVFDSSTGFVLPNGAERSPDAAWLLRTRWEALSDDERERFPPLCPDFVVEVRSRTDRLDPLHDKMREYVANGARLGWLVDPAGRVVWVYRPGGAVDRLDAPASLSGEAVLPGLSLSTAIFW
jgi:Uma2 family endonuclease